MIAPQSKTTQPLEVVDLLLEVLEFLLDGIVRCEQLLVFGLPCIAFMQQSLYFLFVVLGLGADSLSPI